MSDKYEIPDELLESFEKAITPDVIAFYQSEEGKRYYEECLKTEKEQKTKNKTK